MPPFVRGHCREAGAERHANPRCDRRADLGAREVQAVGLTQTVDVLDLVGAERRHDLFTRARRRRLKRGRRLHAEARRRFEPAHEHAREPPVVVRPFAVEALANRVGDPLVELRQIQTRGDVQVIDALRDGPCIRRRGPYELVVGQRRDEQVGVIRESSELPSKRLDLRRKRERRRCRHGAWIVFRRPARRVPESWRGAVRRRAARDRPYRC